MATRKNKKAKRTFEVELTLDRDGCIVLQGPSDSAGYREGMTMCREGFEEITGFVPPESPESGSQSFTWPRWRAKITMELERIR